MRQPRSGGDSVQKHIKKLKAGISRPARHVMATGQPATTMSPASNELTIAGRRRGKVTDG
jgi:hypothetical protein